MAQDCAPVTAPVDLPASGGQDGDHSGSAMQAQTNTGQQERDLSWMLQVSGPDDWTFPLSRSHQIADSSHQRKNCITSYIWISPQKTKRWHDSLRKEAFCPISHLLPSIFVVNECVQQVISTTLRVLPSHATQFAEVWTKEHLGSITIQPLPGECLCCAACAGFYEWGR